MEAGSEEIRKNGERKEQKERRNKERDMSRKMFNERKN